MNKKNLRIPPSNIEAEKAVLGSILLRPRAIVEITSIINKDSFYQTKHATIFEVLMDLYKANVPIDMLSISNTLTDRNLLESLGGNSYIAELTNSVPSSTNVKYYAELVAKAKTLRDVIEMGSKITEIGFNDDYESISSALVDVEKNLISKINLKDSKEDIHTAFKDFEDRQAEYLEKQRNGIELLGISTGYKKLDDVIDGLRPSHFWVIGAYTNMGKTSMSLNIVSELIKQGKRVVYYSLEMTSVDILSRLLGIMSEENGLSIMKGYTKKEKIVAENKKKIIASDLSIHTGFSELSDLLFSMYEETISKKVDVIFVDYMQLIKIKGAKSEYETVTNCSIDLQATAKRLNVPIVVLSQISNEGARANDQVVMSFKGSGAIGSSADLAIEIGIGEETTKDWKEKLHNGLPVKMKWSIRKNRHGRVGMIETLFDGRTGVFKDYDEYTAKQLAVFDTNYKEPEEPSITIEVEEPKPDDIPF